MERRCWKCKKLKPLNIKNFHKDKSRYQKGFTYRCRECGKKYTQEYNKTHKDKRKAYYNIPINRERRKQYMKEYWKRTGKKQNKHRVCILIKGKRRYIILKEPKKDYCEICKTSLKRVHFHHFDYKDLQRGTTLCYSCHSAIHQILLSKLDIQEWLKRYIKLRSIYCDGK